MEAGTFSELIRQLRLVKFVDLDLSGRDRFYFFIADRHFQSQAFHGLFGKILVKNKIAQRISDIFAFVFFSLLADVGMMANDQVRPGINRQMGVMFLVRIGKRLIFVPKMKHNNHYIRLASSLGNAGLNIIICKPGQAGRIFLRLPALRP